MDDNSSVSSRGAVEVCHFALCVAGLFIAAGGVVINCVSVALGGVFLVGWGLLYFLVSG
jgi:hypothetical protein